MKFLIILFTFVFAALADVDITSPDEDKSFSADGDTVKVSLKWKDDSSDSDDDFSLTKAKKYSILLCTGSASYPIECFDTLVDSKSYDNGDDDFSYTASIDADSCDDGYYFFQVYVTFDSSASKATIHYSNRFELKDMTGSTKTLTVENTYDDGSPPDNTIGADTSVNSASFSITYTKQTGKTRYAPMQLQPGTTVTASQWSRKYPTSEYTAFSTIAGTPSFVSTLTPGWSYTPKSVVNWASVAETPSVAYDPKERVTPASLSTASKKRRWLD